MLNGNGTLSLRKTDLENQKILATGFRKTMFAHKAATGETGINLSSLTVPPEMTANGFSQPTTADLAGAQLLFYRNNLRIISSARGLLQDFVSYTVTSSNRINFVGFTALEGEIFIGTIDYNAQTGVKVVDARSINATGTLAINTTDFNVGSPFKIAQNITTQIGAVMVFLDGVIQMRNTSNSSSVLDGNYYEVDVGTGLGTVIRFNTSDPDNVRNVLAVSNGLLSERPDGSMMAAIESIQGQVNNAATYLASVTGLAVSTILGGAPTNQDLQNFGNRVLTLEQNRARIDLGNTWTAAQSLPIGTLINGIRADTKQYVVGTAYTNGTITTTGPTGWTVVRGVFVPYQTSDGAWRLRFNIQGTITTGSSGTQDITISGVTSKNVSNFNQPISMFTNVSAALGPCYVPANGNTLRSILGNSTSTALGLSGDFELDSKPTWAD